MFWVSLLGNGLKVTHNPPTAPALPSVFFEKNKCYDRFYKYYDRNFYRCDRIFCRSTWWERGLHLFFRAGTPRV